MLVLINNLLGVSLVPVYKSVLVEIEKVHFWNLQVQGIIVQVNDEY